MIGDRVSTLDEIVPFRVADREAPATALLAGGVGWRPGVPHIIIYLGDTKGAAAFEVTQDLGLADPHLAWSVNGNDNLYVFPYDYVPPASTYIQPVSTRASGPMHINLLKTPANEYDANHQEFWVEDEYGYHDWESVYSEPNEEGEYLFYYGNERQGHIGAWWLGDPNTICTVEQTLAALAAQNISVIGLCAATFEGKDFSGLPMPYGWFNKTAEEWNTLATTPSLDTTHTYFWYDEPSLNGYYLDPQSWIEIEAAAIAHLTGAIDPETGKNLGWSLYRYTDPITLEPPVDLAARMIPDIVAHAAHLGNGNKFDVAFAIDSSASFSGANSRAAQVITAVVGALRDVEADIFVAISRFSEYSYRQIFNGAFEERPYVLQYALASVADPADYAALIEAANADIPGGGGDTPETQWEALYQLASGAGIDANLNGSTLDSGEPTVPGHQPVFPSDEYDEYYTFDFDDSKGTGYLWPGNSGDVPAYGGGFARQRGVANIADKMIRVWHYPGSGAQF